MQTIPDAVLDAIVEHRPHMAVLVLNLHAHPVQAPQIEKHIASAYLSGEIHLSGTDTWSLAQVAGGGPWGGDWWPLSRAAIETGYDHGTLRRMLNDRKLAGLKYGKTWYIRRDALPARDASKAMER